MKNRCRLYSLLLVSLAAFVSAQTSSVQPPCDYSGDLLRNNHEEIVRFTSNEMKERATHKADISRSMKQMDIKGTAIVDVLVDPTGQVFCTKSLFGLPMLRTEVEKALRAWTFKPAQMNGKSVGYLGRLVFSLCNISCGEAGPSMTLLK
jgi:hypothetical protein